MNPINAGFLLAWYIFYLAKLFDLPQNQRKLYMSNLHTRVTNIMQLRK